MIPTLCWVFNTVLYPFSYTVHFLLTSQPSSLFSAFLLRLCPFYPQQTTYPMLHRKQRPSFRELLNFQYLQLTSISPCCQRSRSLGISRLISLLFSLESTHLHTLPICILKLFSPSFLVSTTNILKTP